MFRDDIMYTEISKQVSYDFCIVVFWSKEVFYVLNLKSSDVFII